MQDTIKEYGPRHENQKNIVEDISKIKVLIEALENPSQDSATEAEIVTALKTFDDLMKSEGVDEIQKLRYKAILSEALGSYLEKFHGLNDQGHIVPASTLSVVRDFFKVPKGNGSISDVVSQLQQKIRDYSE